MYVLHRDYHTGAVDSVTAASLVMCEGTKYGYCCLMDLCVTEIYK